MHHYALMTDATEADLTTLENSMKSFFSRKMQGTLSLEQTSAESKNAADEAVTTWTESTTNKTVATETAKADGSAVV